MFTGTRGDLEISALHCGFARGRLNIEEFIARLKRLNGVPLLVEFQQPALARIVAYCGGGIHASRANCCARDPSLPLSPHLSSVVRLG